MIFKYFAKLFNRILFNSKDFNKVLKVKNNFNFDNYTNSCFYGFLL